MFLIILLIFNIVQIKDNLLWCILREICRIYWKYKNIRQM